MPMEPAPLPRWRRSSRVNTSVDCHVFDLPGPWSKTPDSWAFAQRKPVDQVDRWWNVAVEDQANDRAFRIGQRRASQVQRFFCTGTIEEMIGPRVITRPAWSAAASDG